jgi:RNA polymerase sigma-70 factor (ECF subfamily)
MSDCVSDGHLITQLQGGDLDALGALYERYKARVYRTALAITREPAAAEDLLQDTFLRLHKYAHRINASLPLEPWLYRVTVNLAFTRQARQKRWLVPLETVLDRLASPNRLPEWQVEMDDLHGRIVAAIAELPFNQRTVVVLFYLNALNLKEIAYILNCPVGTVKSRLHYGRENLIRRLATEPRPIPEVVYEYA